MIGLLRRWRERFTATTDRIDAAQWQAAEARLPFLAHLSPAQRQRLRDLARRFIAEKQWHGAQGLDITLAMQLSIALQACLLVLELGLERYNGWLGIIVYPGDFVIPRQIVDENGVMHEYDDVVLGEAWEGGPVLLSWFEEDGHPDGINIVIHEFAHKLDMADGCADGLPPLPASLSRREWQRVLTAAYEDFCRRVDEADFRGADAAAATLDHFALDPYASESPAEFFAVMSEAFFETPLALHGEYPDVYRLLAAFYGQDPRAAAAGQASERQPSPAT